MERLQRAAILLSLIERLRAEESWCGETHVQKATYFLQELTGAPLDLEFVLYKHGPFSFDLRDDLGAMLGDNQLALQPQQYPYGPKFVPGKRATLLKRLYARSIEHYGARSNFVAGKLGRMNVADLERIATALYVTRADGASRDRDVEARAQGMHELKRHISLTDACAAIRQIDGIIGEFEATAVGLSLAHSIFQAS